MSSEEGEAGRLPVSFSAEESSILRRMVEFYEGVKALILYVEEIEDANFGNPEMLKELRDALEHLMRVIACKTGLRNEPDIDYSETNLDKAFGHVYRAGFDALDWLSIVLRRKINRELSPYSTSAIQASLPEYYGVMRPAIEGRIAGRIAEVRASKDIGVTGRVAIEEYAGLVFELKDYWGRVSAAKPSLVEYADKERGERRKAWALKAVLVLAAAGVGAFLTWLLAAD